MRTGWRIVREWVMAQMAMVDAGLMPVEEIFFSQAVSKSGQTIFQIANDDPGRLLQTSN